MKIDKRFKILLCILVIMIFSIVFISKGFENDLFFDLKTGENILKYGIDFKDHFSFIPNLIYIYHHWFYDLIVFFFFEHANYTGLFLFFNFLYTCFGLTIFCVNKKISNNNVVSLLIALFTMYICNYAFQSRVQSLTFILFFLEFYIINKLYEKGEKKYLFILIIISILIANLHMPLWIFSIILILPYMFEFICKVISDKMKLGGKFSDKLIIENPSNKKFFMISFIILLFTGLVTPLGFNPYTFFTKSLFNNSYLIINEMKKTVLIYCKFEIILMIIFIAMLLIKKIKIQLRDLVLVLGLLIFSLIAERNVIYFYIFVPTIMMKIIYQSKIKFELKLNKLRGKFNCINRSIVLLFTNLCLLFIYGICLYEMDFKNFDYGIADKYPVKTVQYIKSNLDYKNMHLYNNFNYGSFLAFNDIPVFIDSRAEVYIKEFNGGKDILNDYNSAGKYSNYKKILEKYKINYALVYKDSDMYTYLTDDSDYVNLFEENLYVLFAKIK